MPLPSRRSAETAARARLAALAAQWSPREEPLPPAPSRARFSLEPRALRALLAIIAGALAIAGWAWWNGRPLAAEPVPVVASGAPSAASGAVVVDVAGEVRTPGILTLPAGSRVADAIAAAGGATGKATGLNLARVLVDGEQVVVGAAATGGGADGRVPINTADAGALDALPGIGPVLAARIVDWRAAHGPFASVDALGDVPGIGPSLMAQLKPLVTT